MSIITAFSMFFISFAPLWISVIFLDYMSIYQGNDNIFTEIISISLILLVFLLSLLILIPVFNPHNAKDAHQYQIKTAREEKSVTAEFLLSYILPLFAFDFALWYETVLFLIFFGTFSFLSIRHNHFSVNVVLELMRYRFYVCDLENEDGKNITKTVISQKILSAHIGSTIDLRPINNDFAVMVKPSK